MNVFCHVAACEVKNLLVFFLSVLDGLLLCGFISHSDQLKTLHDCLLASADIRILRKKT